MAEGIVAEMKQVCTPDTDEAARRRPPEQVMRLARMGAFFPTRLSFMRTLIRRLHSAKTQIQQTCWEVDEDGYGRAVYQLRLSGRDYALVALTNALDPDMRTDRVIAEAWDAAFVLFDGVPSPADLDRLQQQAPKQEAARFTASELVLSRANKSLRLFAHVVDALAQGQQPDPRQLAKTGYLMRTTAVYGNGKFGIADRARLSDRPEMQGPFQAEMLCVYLIRHFTHDLVNHIAKARNPDAAQLAPNFCRYLGVGNSTGLGMAPFLVTHPVLVNNWMLARETALSRVRGLAAFGPQQRARIVSLAARATRHIAQWQVADADYTKRIEILASEWADICSHISGDILAGPYPFEALYKLAQSCSLDCQEMMVGLLLEVAGEEIDDLENCMDSHSDARLDPSMRVGRLRQILAEQFGWTDRCDTGSKKGQAQFWYESEEKLEPRLGLRYEEPGAQKERPLDIARRAQELKDTLSEISDDMPNETSVAEFLLAHPRHRYIVRRVQTAPWAPYGEIQDNLIDADCLPIDMLRCKLSFFGASRFDPKSDKWTRITLYAGAPLVSDLGGEADCDDWWLPVLEGE